MNYGTGMLGWQEELDISTGNLLVVGTLHFSFGEIIPDFHAQNPNDRPAMIESAKDKIRSAMSRALKVEATTIEGRE